MDYLKLNLGSRMSFQNLLKKLNCQKDSFSFFRNITKISGIYPQKGEFLTLNTDIVYNFYSRFYILGVKIYKNNQQSYGLVLVRKLDDELKFKLVILSEKKEFAENFADLNLKINYIYMGNKHISFELMVDEQKELIAF